MLGNRVDDWLAATGKTARRTLALCALSFALSSCANLNSISRSSTVRADSTARVITVDAKQRHLFLTPDLSNPRAVQWRICAEASPDVFSALASSGALKVDLSETPSGEAGFAMAETAATIQRTQSLNLIRESFYHTCERFASGAISRSEFIVQAARDQRAMVSILAIEQLTGAVRPPATILSGPATQASVFSGQEAAALVRDYRERRDKAEATRDAAKTAFDAAQSDGGVCADGDAKDEVKCAELKLAADNAQTELNSAQAGLDNALAVAKNLTDAAAASTLAGTNSTGGLTISDLDGRHLEAVAAAVVDIHKAAVINESLMFCIAWLTSNSTDSNAFAASTRERIADSCIEIVEEAAVADRAILADRWLPPPARRVEIDGVVTAFGTFRDRLDAKIRATAAAQLVARLKLFETRAGAPLGADGLCASSTSEQCANLIRSRDLYGEPYRTGAEKLEQALTDWDKPEA